MTVRTKTSQHVPTAEQFRAYQAMYDYFNAVLFLGSLSPVLLNFSRAGRAYGFFAPERWESADARTHEISLNPHHLLTRPAIETTSTLVHEMVHLWQWEQGKTSRRGYHNQEWAEKMQAVGLMPSDTGLPGGRLTGQRMTHYIIDSGPFSLAFAEMPSEHLLPWQALPDPQTAAGGAKKGAMSRNKAVYSCPNGHGKVWGKPELDIRCGICGRRYEDEA